MVNTIYVTTFVGNFGEKLCRFTILFLLYGLYFIVCVCLCVIKNVLINMIKIFIESINKILLNVSIKIAKKVF